MKKSYTIRKIQKSHGEMWLNTPVLTVDCYPWDENGYKPKAEVQCLYDDKHLHVRFKAYEESITVHHFHINESIYKDSCVEFFFKPNPEKDQRYMNFEINPLGVFLLEIGEGRFDRQKITGVSEQTFHIRTSVQKESLDQYHEDFWTVELSIPFSFIEKHYGTLRRMEGYKMEGNFYKCGDETPNPHYGCWNPIVKETPDFHRPEFFGELIFEEDRR